MTTNTASLGNVYDLQKVVLSPIMDDQSGTLDNNLEPPFVRVRASNASIVHIDTFDKKYRINSSSYLVQQPNIIPHRAKRIAFEYYSAALTTPNINPRNNTIIFTTSSGTFNTTIPEGFYNRTQAIAALVAALNSVPGTGVVWSMPNQFANLDTYAVLTGTGPFRIQGGTFVTGGGPFWGFLPGDDRLTPTSPFVTTLPLGPITTLYTRYYDLTSQYLLRYTKIRNSGNKLPGNHLFRVYADAELLTLSPNSPLSEAFELNTNAAYNLDASSSLATIDLQIVDEFNQPFYFPNGDYNGSWVAIAMCAEI